MSDDTERLQRLLGRADLRWLLAAVRRRLERGGGDRLSVSGLEPPQRAAAEALFGRRAGTGRSFSFRLPELEAILQRAGAARDLVGAIERLTGPLVDHRAEQARARGAWDAVFAAAESWTKERGLERWLDDLRRNGLLKRLAEGEPSTAERLLNESRRVIERLPSHGESLSTLAARATGDAHGLDPGRPLAALVRRALRYIADLTAEPDDPRALWATVGVSVGGALTSTVLVLNLPACGDTPTDRSLVLQREAGEPTWLTLRQLLRQPPGWRASGSPIHICENPAVVAEAADAFGADSPPLVCTYGRPTAAVTTLLDSLTAAGAELHYHGDFDWTGIAIANAVISRYDALPWRFAAADYRRAAETGEMPLTGNPVIAHWDPSLTDTMRNTGIAVHEESVMSLLLADLVRMPQNGS
ncbi:TIGR02679 family protein [Thiohalomonas denitrificans]|uniref:TIGR02679 family protein n=1 Tax=Thiohalomonas denitrificans TaxID=415747 RepID=A0A1G5QEI3_9GAMM|nr:TIGR02679 family protein [Thiohalomonas denitrificans]SCZ60072.1 TIGR02679 family protein [Thiohalomonas denitrificans]